MEGKSMGRWSRWKEVLERAEETEEAPPEVKAERRKAVENYTGALEEAEAFPKTRKTRPPEPKVS
jgi:hypothetical protein